MSPAEYGQHLAAAAPPISDAQALEFAQIMLTNSGQVAA